jgi:hypothetical protein
MVNELANLGKFDTDNQFQNGPNVAAVANTRWFEYTTPVQKSETELIAISEDF